MSSRGGRPHKPVDPELLERLAACGCTINEMAAVMNCSRRTLERRFTNVIEAGWLRGHSSLRHKQFQIAMKGDKTMLIWLGKQRLGQTDRMVITQSLFNDAMREIGKIVREFVPDQATYDQIATEVRKISMRVGSL